MNKKLHFLLFCLAVIVIIYLSKDKILEPFGKLEPFGNQIVIHPDNASFDPQETTFSVLTYDSDLGSGVTQVSTCSDDSSWRNGDKTCRDYSLDGTNCEDIGSDGRSAFDACKVACDNCNTYTEVKRRIPSPIEDTDEPTYAQFESSASDGGDFGSVGGVDIREILGKLEELSGKIDLIEINSGGSSGAAITCSEVDMTGTPEQNEDACNDVPGGACTYTPANSETGETEVCAATDAGSGISQADTERKCTDIIANDEACNGNNILIQNASSMSVGGSSNPDNPQDICCTSPLVESVQVPGGRGNCDDFPCGDGYTLKETLPTQDSNEEPTTENCCDRTGFCKGNAPGIKDVDCGVNSRKPDGTVGRSRGECCVPPTCTDSVCTDGYTPKTPTPTLVLNQAVNPDNCCKKTGFCKGNEGEVNDIPCIWPYYTDKVDSDGKPIAIVGQTFNNCCEYNLRWWRFLVWVVLIAVFSGYILFKGHGNESRSWDNKFIILSVISSGFIIISDTIPRWIIHRNSGKWITAYPQQWWWWSWIVDFLTAASFILWLASGVFMYYGK